MAVPHSYHCAPDQIHGGEAGKVIQVFTAAAAVYMPWYLQESNYFALEMCQHDNIIICYYIVHSSRFGVYTHYMLQ